MYVIILIGEEVIDLRVSRGADIELERGQKGGNEVNVVYI